MSQRLGVHPINIGMLLTRNARCRPDHLGIVFEETQVTFREFNRNVNQIANALRGLGIDKGDKIAIQMPNTLQYPIVLIGALRAGLIVVNTNPLSSK